MSVTLPDSACAMSHAAAQDCTQRLAAGDWLQGLVTGIGLQRPVYSPSAELAVVQPVECE